MKIKTGIVAAMVLALAAATPAFAQQLGGGNAAVLSDHSVSTSKLIGEKVYDDRGTAVGSVVDIVLKGQGAEPGVILSVGDYVGGGKKMVSVPMSHVHLDGAKAMMPTTKQAMMDLPAWILYANTSGGG
jgi:sporulation protein YlmC with PRC-barrel domain